MAVAQLAHDLGQPGHRGRNGSRPSSSGCVDPDRTDPGGSRVGGGHAAFYIDELGLAAIAVDWCRSGRDRGRVAAQHQRAAPSNGTASPRCRVARSRAALDRRRVALGASQSSHAEPGTRPPRADDQDRARGTGRDQAIRGWGANGSALLADIEREPGIQPARANAGSGGQVVRRHGREHDVVDIGDARPASRAHAARRPPPGRTPTPSGEVTAHCPALARPAIRRVHHPSGSSFV